MSHDEEHGYDPTQGTIGAARVTIEVTPLHRAKAELFVSLQAGGCSEPAGVLEAIEALIDAKRAEELDAPDAWMELAVVPRTAGQLTGPYAELGPLPTREQVAAAVEKRWEDDLALQSRGNEDAQTPGIDEDSDSEAVTVDLDWIASAVVDGIEADLDDRAGLGLDVLDDEVRGEIRAHWLNLVMVALRKVSP